MLREDFQNVAPPIVPLLSGGMDSTVLLYELLTGWKGKVFPIAFNYGQRHKRELTAAAAICSRLNTHLRILDFPHFATIASSSQTNAEVPVPEGHYTDASMRVTVVPNRNAVMLNIAAAYAIDLGANTLAYGAHAGDHSVYVDCRPEFVEAMAVLLQVVDYHKLDLFVPYLNRTKRQIAEAGRSLKVPFELTWSCYKGGARHCGRCATCIERREALDGFDPTEYEDNSNFWKEVLRGSR